MGSVGVGEQTLVAEFRKINLLSLDWLRAPLTVWLHSNYVEQHQAILNSMFESNSPAGEVIYADVGCPHILSAARNGIQNNCVLMMDCSSMGFKSVTSGHFLLPSDQG